MNNYITHFLCVLQAPLDYEMIVLFALIHTPLSIINFAIHKTRDNYETSTQLAAGIVRVLYTFARILWHAQIEGNKMYKKVGNLKLKLIRS